VPGVLAILERPYRGAVEVQFSDSLYFARELNRQLGQIELALRGLAVTLAVPDDRYRPCLELGSRRLDTLPDYRGAVGDLLADGVPIIVDEPDLRALGLGSDRLLAGVHCADTNLLAQSWSDYEGVWFL
jgi:hypothetical protein